jgi:putative ABC transport system permease protein
MELHFLLSYLLVLIALTYSFFKKLELEKEIIINSIRALVQLFLLGLFLSYIFALEGIGYYLVIFCVMVAFGAYTAYKRVGYFLQAFIALGISSMSVLAVLVFLQVISLRPNEIIPIGGMIIGNSLNVYTLFVERYKNEIRQNKNLIEQYLALGLHNETALTDIDKMSVKASLIPIMNTMQTVGIIHIPGIMAGMIIAGADPMSAVTYQVVIMYMILATALFSALSAKFLLQKTLLKF